MLQKLLYMQMGIHFMAILHSLFCLTVTLLKILEDTWPTSSSYRSQTANIWQYSVTSFTSLAVYNCFVYDGRARAVLMHSFAHP